MVGLRNGSVELRYDLGAGQTVVQSAPLSLGQSADITMHRSVVTSVD